MGSPAVNVARRPTFTGIVDELVSGVEGLRFSSPVSHVYNPLDYARLSFLQYASRYARPCEALLVGMNPGPWGMAQTGVPFGVVSMVRNWLAIDASIGRPAVEHPRRRVEGFNCKREEVSGLRLWGWAKERFGTPERFFDQFFVYNYCPLMFMEESGRNRTPDKLTAREQARLYVACDRALEQMVEHLRPRWVIGVGAFAEGRVKEALKGRNVRIGRILHPSPASPAANCDWAGTVDRQLAACGLRFD